MITKTGATIFSALALATSGSVGATAAEQSTETGPSFAPPAISNPIATLPKNFESVTEMRDQLDCDLATQWLGAANSDAAYKGEKFVMSEYIRLECRLPSEAWTEEALDTWHEVRALSIPEDKTVLGQYIPQNPPASNPAPKVFTDPATVATTLTCHATPYWLAAARIDPEYKGEKWAMSNYVRKCTDFGRPSAIRPAPSANAWTAEAQEVWRDVRATAVHDTDPENYIVGDTYVPSYAPVEPKAIDAAVGSRADAIHLFSTCDSMVNWMIRTSSKSSIDGFKGSSYVMSAYTRGAGPNDYCTYNAWLWGGQHDPDWVSQGPPGPFHIAWTKLSSQLNQDTGGTRIVEGYRVDDEPMGVKLPSGGGCTGVQIGNICYH